MKKNKKLRIGTNTKMYKTISQTVDFLTSLDKLTSDIDRNSMELFVIPSFTTLETARKSVSRESIRVGAQNMCWEDEGQFTGEISPVMLKEVGIDLIEIGHSERRHVFGETDIEENKKVLAAVKHNFTSLLCIGETLEQKNFGVSEDVLRTQLKIGLYNVKPEDCSKIWIAYEPVWAIGVNGIPATKEYASEMHVVIRNTLVELFGKEVATEIPILYGGSVNPENAPELIQMPEIDGLFIGRSAWQADNFNKLIREALSLFQNKK